ncbi:MAG: disulfide bond formation protein DsbD [Fluviicola sp.]|nr:MAG: disulfide bond formation protein DsbD [Fluviicola sp.]
MKYIFSLVVVFITTFLFSQQSANDVTKWKTSVEQEKGAEEATLCIEAVLDDGWYGYSIKETPNGPLPTDFTFDESEDYELIGEMSEKGMKKGYDKVFEADVRKFYPSGTFKQKIKVKSKSDFILTASIFYQVCTDGTCIIGDKNIDFSISGVKSNAKEQEVDPLKEQGSDENIEKVVDSIPLTNSDLVEWSYELKEVDKNGRFNLSLEADIADGYSMSKVKNLQGLFKVPDGKTSFSTFMLADGVNIEDGFYASPILFRSTIVRSDDAKKATKITATLELEKDGETVEVEKDIVLNFANAELLVSGECEPLRFEGAEDEEEFSYWELMIEAFLWGIASLLTPCVFPMIPMTVTFFLKGAKEKTRAAGIRKATGYGLSIIGIYTFIGTIVAVTLGAAFANWLATHWIPNVLFFLIFMFFAASFLGMFEIRMPSSLINKSDAKADKGGFIGTFFMALTLVLVSFSCTGPIIGIILIKASQGAILEPMLGMFAFSLAFALPFTLFAIFPSWLSKLPKSGGWLNTVKVVLGFLEIALGLKFLSVADQTYHWGILDREVYIGLWIVIFTMLALYLLGKIKLAHDSDMPYLKVPRLFFAMSVLAFVVYLTPGLFGHPLKALSGYLPPMSTHDFNLLGEIRGEDENQCGDDPKYSDFLHLPHGIAGYFDYEEAMACAKAQEKPLFIDFTGHGCVNCREMEAQVWSDPAILKMLKEEFIVVAIYVDDKTPLPESEWVESKVDGKMKTTIGDKNLDFQICKFDESAQPLYATMDGNEQLLAKPVGYVSVKKFKQFLEQSIVEFKKKSKGKSPI